jgi:hypothetical protein
MTLCIARVYHLQNCGLARQKSCLSNSGVAAIFFCHANRLRYTRWQEKNTPIPELVKLATFLIHQAICMSEKFLDCFSELA